MKQFDNNHFYFPSLSSNQEINLLLNALDLTKAGVVVTDCSQPDNPIVYCNAAFEELTGYTHDDVIGRNCRVLQGADEHERERYIMKNALLSGQDCVVEIKNYKKDGSPFWNELKLHPIKDERGDPLYYIGIQHDISEKKRKEELTEAFKTQKYLELLQNPFLKAIFNTVNESLLLLNEQKLIILANTSFFRTFHLAEEEVIHRNLFEMQEGRWAFMALRNLLEHLNPQRTSIKNYPLEHVFPHVGKKMLSINAQLLSEEEGHYTLLALEDMTEIAEIERRKDDFLNVASHELKTPLTTIMSSLQLAQRMLPVESDERLKETLKKAKTYVDRLGNLVADLLDVAKIRIGQIELDTHPFNLDEMIFNMVKRLKIIHHHVIFQIEGFASSYYIGDKNRLEQVMIHLLHNSIKFSPKGAYIRIHLSRLSDYIKIAITDNGLGVSQQHQKRIFDNFYRVDEIQKQFSGIGTGLYISDQIIRNHGGALWVESNIGEGATFSFTLPLKHTQL